MTHDDGEFRYDSVAVSENWARLHAGDAEPLPEDPAVLEAWTLFHNGHFHQAAKAGLHAGGAGITVANKATCLYANYLEKREKVRLELFMEVAERARAQAADHPDNANAHYWLAYALGRYSQGISVAKALAQGLGTRVKETLETTIRLEPRHADAHVALAAFQAEVIDKVGALIGGMTYGARKDASLKLFHQGLQLHPESAIALIEYANGLVMLEGDDMILEATRLYEQAAISRPADAAERLAVALARAELDDG
ncbi:hypothetical protein ACO2Q9_13025 [Variovorax sp. VNK109]|jgi:hypothetical protein|uniref:hypothetical protein n=1 Tax=Variovorax sp. VNK109 TaxID=3400919 RepID=UPI003BFF22B9